MSRRLAFIGLGALLAACNVPQVREDFHQSVSSAGAPLVRVENAVGEIRIGTWQKHTVDIEAVKTANSIDDVRNIHIDVTADGDTITIASKYHAASRGGVRYTITVPADASVFVDNSVGAVHLDGVAGNVTVTTQTGEVQADLGRVAGHRSVDLTATTGSVRLAIDALSDARVEAQSKVGSFSSDFPSITMSRENVVGMSASGTIGKGRATIHLATTTGSISLRR